MKGFLFFIPAVLVVSGCAMNAEKPSVGAVSEADYCLGSTDLPKNLAPYFDEVDDPELLASTIGEPDKGMLCQGKVYQAKEDTDVPVYRAWNSTNPNSQFGNWWAFDKPRGLTATYREDYEICYQWSPLDKLVSCTLRAGSKVVVGNGQSATCSQYLTYNKSAAQQVYIQNSEQDTLHCDVKDAEFSWK